ncbi:aminopeptidase, partial [Streptococcus sp. DD11]|uniref:aminopeptidase n=1 Tax=Streptococcus sp. DD11 TaxID=1777879 RepID=UPI001F496D73
FKASKVYEEDPTAAWLAHRETLTRKAQVLNQAQFAALHYQAPGTDLTLSMPQNHHWDFVGGDMENGDYCIANMPTEEIYSAPDFRSADGYVTSTKPLSYMGQMIEGMKLTFKDGRIIDIYADQGLQLLKEVIAQDDGAQYLGEIALVPDKTPISQSGLTFFNTLFDENASCHLAIGAAYPISVVGGEHLSAKEQKAAGLNQSAVHLDFMIGSDQLDIDGIRSDGSRVPIFRKGDWAI